jgi:hypothetical protein
MLSTTASSSPDEAASIPVQIGPEIPLRDQNCVVMKSIDLIISRRMH